MNNVQIFTNQDFGKIRTVEENGRILFCGSDIARALGYKDTPKAIKQHCKEDGWAFYPVSYSSGTKQVAMLTTLHNSRIFTSLKNYFQKQLDIIIQSVYTNIQIEEVTNIKTLTIRLDDDIHRNFKIYATQQGTDMSALLVEYIKHLLEKPKESSEQPK